MNIEQKSKEQMNDEVSEHLKNISPHRLRGGVPKRLSEGRGGEGFT